MKKDSHKQSVQTTGHAWDGDLQEFNNPLPRWWLWGFYGTVVFAVIYWVLFPAWPFGTGFTTGVLNDITYTTADGREVTRHWNTRSLLDKEMAQARSDQQQFLDELKSASYADIRTDQRKSAFAYSMAKVLYADNCAACHQAGGAGKMGMYPSLADDAWLWGGNFARIEETIRDGRNGYMPAFGKSLDQQQVADVTDYVLSLSGHAVDVQAAARGKDIFNGQDGGCHLCHTREATGLVSLGSANLTDSVWTVADVPGEAGLDDKRRAVREVIEDGVSRQMPGWAGRLNETEIKILTFYVRELGGGV